MFSKEAQASLKVLEEKRAALKSARDELADVMTILLVERGLLIEEAPSWLKSKILKA